MKFKEDSKRAMYMQKRIQLSKKHLRLEVIAKFFACVIVCHSVQLAYLLQ